MKNLRAFDLLHLKLQPKISSNLEHLRFLNIVRVLYLKIYFGCSNFLCLKHLRDRSQTGGFQVYFHHYFLFVVCLKFC